MLVVGVGIKELIGVLQVYDHKRNVPVAVDCHSFQDIPVMKSFIKLLTLN
jgi:hypothetical protein